MVIYYINGPRVLGSYSKLLYDMYILPGLSIDININERNDKYLTKEAVFVQKAARMIRQPDIRYPAFTIYFPA